MLAGKIKTALCAVLALSLIVLAGVCLCTRVSGSDIYAQEVMLAAAALALPDGNYSDDSRITAENPGDNSAVQMRTSDEATADEMQNISVFEESADLYADEKHYPVVETQYSTGELGYNSFFVKNSTGFNLDIGHYLSRSLGFQTDSSNEPQVLIVHTHTSESYLTYDAGYYHESFYPRSSDENKNMIRVGLSIAEGLRKQGIGAIHATEFHDDPVYDGAYYRSYETMEKYIKEYPSIKVVLDIHRDSISYGENGGKVKPTFTYNGKKAAQIMIMAGYDPDGYYDFPFWEDNLTFALKIQDAAENMYPGMTRPLYFGNFAYNMNINNGSLLIEVGTDANTLAEAVYTGELLSNVLAKVLQSN